MSEKLRPSQFADNKSVIVEAFVPNTGLIMEGPTVPVNGLAGYAAGATFFKRGGTAGAQLYINEGSATSCLFLPLPSQANAVGSPVNGVAAGYRIARGVATTVTASDTIVTGLTTVVAAVANLDAGPVVGAEIANASIGNQSGAPAAGSILIQTWSTLGGTPVGATTFTLKVDWIAIGT